MEMISGLYLKIKFYLKKLFYIKSYIYLPRNPKHDDIYLVEYPKSGVTWLSTLIGNINLIESDQKQQITFFNLQQYIPDIHASRELSEFPLWSFPNCRFIKSHDVYNHNYNFIIYIIRDPYRVMNSYYNFMKNLNSFNGDFDEFVLSKKFGIDAWLNHINSWLTKGVTNQKIHVIKYENLEAEFSVVKTYTGCTKPLTTENKSATVDYRSYYSNNLATIVGDVFAKDIVKYNYEF